ncbi:MAG: hypothetical protein WC821_04835 [archaeon]|jgi:hypothetical protein
MVPRKQRVNPNQGDLFAPKLVRPAGIVEASKAKVRKFPIEVLEKRLLKIKVAKSRRIDADEQAKFYKGVVDDLVKGHGKPNPKNISNYLLMLQKKVDVELALARSFGRTGSDRDMVEVHERTAWAIGRYKDVLKQQFKVSQ